MLMKYTDLRQMLGVPGISPVAQTVLMGLSMRSDNSNTCFPTVETIVNDTKLSRSSVLRGLKELAVKELITVKPRPKKSSIYVVNVTVVKYHTDTYQEDMSKQGSGVPGTQMGCPTDTQNVSIECKHKNEGVQCAVAPVKNGDEMGVKEIEKQFSEPETDEAILARKSLLNVFRQAVVKYHPNLKLPEYHVNGIEAGQLKKFEKKVGSKDQAAKAILSCVKNWMAFNVYAEKRGRGVGLVPNPGGLLLGVAAAINFNEKQEHEEFSDDDAKF